MNDSAYKTIVSVTASLVVIYVAWLSSTVIAVKTKSESTAIPQTTELALNEIRTRMNGEQNDRLALREIAIKNANDIGYIKESLSRLEGAGEKGKQQR